MIAWLKSYFTDLEPDEQIAVSDIVWMSVVGATFLGVIILSIAI